MTPEATQYGLHRFSQTQSSDKFGEQGRLPLLDAIQLLENALADLRALYTADMLSVKLEWSWTAGTQQDTAWTVTVERATATRQPVVGPDL